MFTKYFSGEYYLKRNVLGLPYVHPHLRADNVPPKFYFKNQRIIKSDACYIAAAFYDRTLGDITPFACSFNV